MNHLSVEGLPSAARTMSGGGDCHPWRRLCQSAECAMLMRHFFAQDPGLRSARADSTLVVRRLGGGKSLVAEGRGGSGDPRAFADPLTSRQEAPSASAGNAGSTPPAPHRCQSASNVRGSPVRGRQKSRRSSRRACPGRGAPSISCFARWPSPPSGGRRRSEHWPRSAAPAACWACRPARETCHQAAP